MLDLKSWIGFHEEKGRSTGRRIAVNQKLEGPKAAIGKMSRHSCRGVQNGAAQSGVKFGSWRDFDYLLIASLQRAVALESMHHVASVADDLDFDMACAAQKALDINITIAERRLGFGSTASVGVLNFIG